MKRAKIIFKKMVDGKERRVEFEAEVLTQIGEDESICDMLIEVEQAINVRPVRAWISVEE